MNDALEFSPVVMGTASSTSTDASVPAGVVDGVVAGVGGTGPRNMQRSLTRFLSFSPPVTSLSSGVHGVGHEIACGR